MASPLQRISDWFSRLSIRYRLIVYLLLGLIPILLVTSYFTWKCYQGRQDQVLLGHLATARAVAGTVAEFIGGIVRSQEIIGLTIVRENMAYDEMTAYFRATLDVNPILETLAFALPSGAVVAGQPQEMIGIDISDRAYFRRIASGQDWTVSQLLACGPTGEPAFIIAHRVERDGRLAGAIISAVPPESLQNFVLATAVPGVSYSVLDSSARIVVTTVLPARVVPQAIDRSWIPSIRNALAGKSAFAEPFEDRADGVRRMGAAVPVTGIGWAVSVFESTSTAMAPVQRAGLIDMALHLLIIAALLAAVWIAGTRLGNPIRSLAEKADAVARGDFSQRMEIRDRAELGTLANAFNNMTAELERFTIEERRARERALFLADIGEVLASTLDPEVVLQTVAEKTTGILGDLAAILRVDTAGNLTPVAKHARDPAILEKLLQIVRERPLKVGTGVVGTAVEQDRTIFVPRLSELEDPQERYYLEQVNAVSSIAVPMRVRGEIVGVLSVSSTENPLTEDQVPIAEELARRLGIALENIRLYQDSLEREGFQRGLTDLAAAVSSTLRPEEVLNTICSRAHDLLEVDGVYIWVVDEEEERLFGASAYGFKAEEFVGMSLPLTETGTSAVQAVLRKEGFYVNDMPSSADRGYFLTQKFQTQAALFQPLISAGTVSGVMVAADTREAIRFDDRSMEMARLLAGYAATALANARAYQRERRIAETLQRSLLAETPERIDHFELAHFYAPARAEAAIGGDFYDFIEIGDGQYGLVVGDVSGKGLEAAVVTATAKYVLRAYAAEDPEPATVLARANNAIVKYTAPDLFVTLIYGLFDSRSGRFKYANAGHEPILVYRAGENKLSHEILTGMAAGVVEDEEYTTNELALLPEDMLVMYTDGLTEARSPAGEFLGEEELAGLVLELADQPAQDFLRSLIDRVNSYTAGQFADDVVVLAVRAAPNQAQSHT